MIRSSAVLIAVLSFGAVPRVHAQETSPGPGTVEVTVIPGGGTFFNDQGAVHAMSQRGSVTDSVAEGKGAFVKRRGL